MTINHAGRSLCGEGINNHVVGGRHQGARQRGVRRDVNRIGRAIAFALHDGNHHTAHGRGVGHRRSRYATKQSRGHHIGQTQTTTPMPDQAAREVDDLVGNAAMQHQLTGEDEEWNRQERKHIHAGNHHLNRGFKWQPFHREGGQTGQTNGKCHRHTQDQKEHKAQTQYG